MIKGPRTPTQRLFSHQVSKQGAPTFKELKFMYTSIKLLLSFLFIFFKETSFYIKIYTSHSLSYKRNWSVVSVSFHPFLESMLTKSQTNSTAHWLLHRQTLPSFYSGQIFLKKQNEIANVWLKKKNKKIKRNVNICAFILLAVYTLWKQGFYALVLKYQPQIRCECCLTN